MTDAVALFGRSGVLGATDDDCLTDNGSFGYRLDDGSCRAYPAEGDVCKDANGNDGRRTNVAGCVSKQACYGPKGTVVSCGHGVPPADVCDSCYPWLSGKMVLPSTSRCYRWCVHDTYGNVTCPAGQAYTPFAARKTQTGYCTLDSHPGLVTVDPTVNGWNVGDTCGANAWIVRPDDSLSYVCECKSGFDWARPTGNDCVAVYSSKAPTPREPGPADAEPPPEDAAAPPRSYVPLVAALAAASVVGYLVLR